MPFLTATNLNKSYHVGTQRLHVSARSRPHRRSGRNGRHRWRVRCGQKHAPAPPWRPRSDGLWLDSGRYTDIGSLPEEDLTIFRNKHVGFVFQFHHLLPEFTALENTEMPLRIARVRSADARTRAMAVLERLGLADGAHTGPQCSQVVSNSGSRLRVRWLLNHRSCSRMSQPEIWMNVRPKLCTRFYARCTGSVS